MGTEQLLELLNGIDATTGRYLAPPIDGEEILKRPRDFALDPATLRDWEWWIERYGIDDPDRDSVVQVDPCDLASAGWGVIYAPDVAPEVKEALEPLLTHRRQQASRVHEHYYQEFEYQPGQLAGDFLADHDVDSGPADPEKVPYYLLLVGDPEILPFSFQYELDTQYAVGRLHFDRTADYASYADKVKRAEKGESGRPRQLAFFGVANDPNTRLATDRLVHPLAESIGRALGEDSGWTRTLLVGNEASKPKLARLLGGNETPAFLFTSSHGLAYPLDDPRQLDNQGALVCQEWPGPSDRPEPVDPDHYFSAADLDGSADLTGLIACHFACYSAGTPHLDNFSTSALSEPLQIAPRPFVARLAQKLLSRGALAVLGHVDRAWTTSFGGSPSRRKGGSSSNPKPRRASIETFESTVRTLLDGHPVGSATEYVNQRHAELAVRFSQLLQARQEMRNPPADRIFKTKIACNDARNYVVLGDPAVKMVGTPDPCIPKNDPKGR